MSPRSSLQLRIRNGAPMGRTGHRVWRTTSCLGADKRIPPREGRDIPQVREEAAPDPRPREPRELYTAAALDIHLARSQKAPIRAWYHYQTKREQANKQYG